MGDLTDDELASIERSLGGPALVATSKSETCRMLAELKRHRAAQSASAERVRSVVRETLHARIACVAGWDGFSPGSINRMVEDVADRVASQLGPVGLSAEEREVLAILRDDLQFTTPTHAAVVRPILDRLLGATP